MTPEQRADIIALERTIPDHPNYCRQCGTPIARSVPPVRHYCRDCESFDATDAEPLPPMGSTNATANI